MRPHVSHPGSARSGATHDDGSPVHLRPLPCWSGHVFLVMASSTLPPVVHDEAAARRTRTEGLLRSLRVQADISREYRRVASDAMDERCMKQAARRSTIGGSPKCSAPTALRRPRPPREFGARGQLAAVRRREMSHLNFGADAIPYAACCRSPISPPVASSCCSSPGRIGRITTPCQPPNGCSVRRCGRCCSSALQ
jgi:hypothetical protein